MEKYLKDYLLKYNITYKVHEHEAIFTVEQGKNNKDIQKIPGVRTKNLFLKDNEGKFYLVCLPGEKKLDMKKLKSELNVKNLEFASPEELKSELNLTPGSVSIFGMINSKTKSTTLIIDKEVWDAEIIGSHPNINTETLEIKNKDLKKYIDSLNCSKLILAL